MIRPFILGCFLLLAPLAFMACDSGINITSDNPTTTNRSSSMSAKVNGIDWQPDNNQYGATYIGGVLGIGGLTNAGEAISITLTEIQPGVYTLDQNGLHAAAYSEFSGAISHTSNATADVGGTVEIAAINFDEGWITGTFSFSAYRFTDNTTVNITEGQFTRIPLSTDISSPNSDDTFTAKIDGELWEPPFIFGANQLGKISVSGTDNNTGKGIGLTMPEDVTEGTYEYDILTYIGQYNIDNATFLTADSGELVITKHDKQNKRIEGTFRFEASSFGVGNDNASITEGAFSVSYQ